MVAGYVVMRVGDGLPVGARRAPGPGAARGVPDLHRRDPASRRPAGSRCWSPTRRSPSTFVFVGRAHRSSRSPARGSRERRKGGTPWHPHHIAERYGLLVIIALGRGDHRHDRLARRARRSGGRRAGRVDAALVAIAGIALTFGCGGSTSSCPSGADPAASAGERSFGWGYGHIPLIGAVVATGAGLHVAAYYIEEESELERRRRRCSRVAIPVAVYILGIFVLYTVLARHARPLPPPADRRARAVVLVAPLVLAAAAPAMAWCLLVLALAPWVTVVGYELRGTSTTRACSRG